MKRPDTRRLKGLRPSDPPSRVLLDADERALLSSVARGESIAEGGVSAARPRYAQSRPPLADGCRRRLRKRRERSQWAPATPFAGCGPGFDRALEAMTAPSFFGPPRAAIEALDRRRGRLPSTCSWPVPERPRGFRPGRPSQRLVEQAQSFVEAASHLGYANPADATEYLAGP